MEEENAAALICAALIFSELDLDDGFDEFDQVPPPTASVTFRLLGDSPVG